MSAQQPRQPDEDRTRSDNGLRIAFIHPNLGIGGAERLVVDAAVGLQSAGHHVDVLTSFHDPARSFPETSDGTLRVHVYGDVLPQAVAGKGHIVFAMLRQLHLLMTLLFTLLLGLFSDGQVFGLQAAESYDVYVVDQLSTIVPLLRWTTNTRVVFYCHFPDSLLSPHLADTLTALAGSGAKSKRRAPPLSPAAVARWLYRLPIDKLEEATTGAADKIVVNSEFTAQVFRGHFTQLGKIRAPRVIRPGVQVSEYGVDGPRRDVLVKKLSQDERAVYDSDQRTFISINRFEDKKDVSLAVEAFAMLLDDNGGLRTQASPPRLIIAGGYDPDMKENKSTLQALQKLCDRLKLSHAVFPSATSTSVLFLPNLSHALKLLLLASEKTLLLLYTPSNEHFGIVPLEAMASSLPVLAADSGGPRETVCTATAEQDGDRTGWLEKSLPGSWAIRMQQVLDYPSSELAYMRRAARKRAEALFSHDKFVREFDQVVRDAFATEGRVWSEDGAARWWLAVLVFGVLMPAVLALYVGVTVYYW